MHHPEDGFKSKNDDLVPWQRFLNEFPIGYEIQKKKLSLKEQETSAIKECYPRPFKMTYAYDNLIKGSYFGRTSYFNDSESITRRSTQGSNSNVLNGTNSLFFYGAGSNRSSNPSQSTSFFSEPNSEPITFKEAFEGFREITDTSPTDLNTTSGIGCPSELSTVLSDMTNNLNLGTTIGQGYGAASTTPPIESGLTSCPYDLPVLAPPFFLNKIWSVSSDLNSNCDSDFDSIERAARLHRIAATFSEVNYNWSGPLPHRSNKDNKDPAYSRKVFLGGVPRNITEAELVAEFAPFGPVEIVWPANHNHGASYSSKSGYNYIIFESGEKVKAFLQACTHHDYSDGDNWYFRISYRRLNSIEVQVIPWVLSDKNYDSYPSPILDAGKTIFVGGLHGLINAERLAFIMNDKFGGVIHAFIDTDKYSYPIGSGLVTFDNEVSFIKAVSAAFIEIKTPMFKKRVQLDPYITEDAMCSGCKIERGPIFCRDLGCFRYFCRSCWKWQHSVETFTNHKPIMRKQRNRQIN